MTGEHPIQNEDCKGDLHDWHLCYLVAYGYHLNNEEEFKNLVNHAKYKCCICGRIANDAKNLCKPVEL